MNSYAIMVTEVPLMEAFPMMVRTENALAESGNGMVLTLILDGESRSVFVHNQGRSKWEILREACEAFPFPQVIQRRIFAGILIANGQQLAARPFTGIPDWIDAMIEQTSGLQVYFEMVRDDNGSGDVIFNN